VILPQGRMLDDRGPDSRLREDEREVDDEKRRRHHAELGGREQAGEDEQDRDGENSLDPRTAGHEEPPGDGVLGSAARRRRRCRHCETPEYS
jgi:hypothetical protein